MCYIATVAEISGSERHIASVGICSGLLKLFELSLSSEEIQIKFTEISV